MFGLNNDDKSQTTATNQNTSSPPTLQQTPQPQPQNDTSATSVVAQHPLTSDNPFSQTNNTNTNTDNTLKQDPTPPNQTAPIQPPNTSTLNTNTSTATTTATNGDDTSAIPTSIQSSDNASPFAAPDTNKLSTMKQEALDHLEPLVEHLEQSPEEQFKTTMMMIQANDNHALIEKALAAAKQITDDKTRAQAMLDIINEINYFAQNTVN